MAQDDELAREAQLHAEALITTHLERLRKLELKAAAYGRLNCPVDIELEIDDVRHQIAIQAQTAPSARLIRHAEIRAHLESAETSLSKGEYQPMAIQAVRGLMRAFEYLFQGLVSSGDWERIAPAQFSGPPYSREFVPTLYMIFGLPYAEFLRVEAIAVRIIALQVMSKAVASADAVLVLRYCLRTILKLEDQVDSLDHPFDPFPHPPSP